MCATYPRPDGNLIGTGKGQFLSYAPRPPSPATVPGEAGAIPLLLHHPHSLHLRLWGKLLTPASSHLPCASCEQSATAMLHAASAALEQVPAARGLGVRSDPPIYTTPACCSRSTPLQDRTCPRRKLTHSHNILPSHR